MSKHLQSLLKFLFCKNNFFIRKKTVVEIISVAIDDSSDVLCFDRYLTNLFVKSTTAERCTDAVFRHVVYLLLMKIKIYDEDINIKIYHKYFRYSLFCCPRFYFWCTVIFPALTANLHLGAIPIVKLSKSIAILVMSKIVSLDQV